MVFDAVLLRFGFPLATAQGGQQLRWGSEAGEGRGLRKSGCTRRHEVVLRGMVLAVGEITVDAVD
ncbi:hypothetical protein FCH28_15735 [Streptomyces piniterrae]|uniref:Uncharacterized protein n=1 Tax=Streptomyces piniterrae TaxID=2571125 RepID=A0A4U0NL97_9ACTN|nr:hypothetical protein [Streptomyces piniterrae]TJZ54552.1 hypothetical protein FCH28_15735 [Streptomyces piniterrae]